MTAPAPVSPSKKPSPADQRPVVPPDEQFWVRYSPHNEFPLSSVATVCFYVLLGVLVWLGIKVLAPLFLSDLEPIPVEAIALAGGGGGDPSGSGGLDSKERPPEDLGKNDEQNLPEDLKPPVSLTKLERPEIQPEQFKEVDPTDDGVRYIEQKNMSAVSLSKVGEEARKQLMTPLRASKGSGGTGRDGGKESGRDKGVGDGDKDGKIMNERQKRVLRWTMMFDTRNGDDYRVQLMALGAILGIPGPDGQYRIIRDLKSKPAKMEVEDLKTIKRIFWVDDRPDSIGPLAQALGIQVPHHVVAFFPEKLEADLLRKELSFRHLKEHQIQETRFRVVRSGNGFEPRVVDQR